MGTLAGTESRHDTFCECDQLERINPRGKIHHFVTFNC